MMVPVCTPFRGSGGSSVPVWFRSGGLVWTHYRLVTAITKPLQPVLSGSPIQTDPCGGYYHFEKCFADTRITVEPLLEVAL